MFNIITLNQALCGLRTFKRYTCITKHRKRERKRGKFTFKMRVLVFCDWRYILL